MKAFLLRLRERWLTFWRGDPCPKHPGHRVREFDAELATRCSMMPSMCSECFREMEERIAAERPTTMDDYRGTF